MTKEEMLFELYCKDVITKEELAEKLNLLKKQAIDRYLDLYLEGAITKEDLVAALCELD